MSRNYLVFDVQSVLLPAEASVFWEEFRGHRLTQIVDINGNGRPDSGDAGIPRYGDTISRIEIEGTVEAKPTVLVNEGWLRNRGWQPETAPVRYTSEFAGSVRLFVWGTEESLYDYGEQRNNEASQFVSGITEHPVLSTLLGWSLIGAFCHPVGRAGLTILLGAQSVKSGVEFSYDKVDGLVNGSPMGEEDGANVLMMVGGVQALQVSAVRVSGYLSRLAISSGTTAMELGEALLSVGQREAALVAFQRAYAEAKEACNLQGELKAAMQMVATLRMGGDLKHLADAHQMVGRALEFLGRLDEAMEAYRQQWIVLRAALMDPNGAAQNIINLQRQMSHVPRVQTRPPDPAELAHTCWSD